MRFQEEECRAELVGWRYEKGQAEYSYGAGGWEHTGGTLSFSITQINPLTLSLATSTSLQKTE